MLFYVVVYQKNLQLSFIIAWFQIALYLQLVIVAVDVIVNIVSSVQNRSTQLTQDSNLPTLLNLVIFYFALYTIVFTR